MPFYTVNAENEKYISLFNFGNNFAKCSQSWIIFGKMLA